MNDATVERIRTNRQERLRVRYGPWAVVTGASSGIGREMALRLAESGFNLVLVARGRDVMERMAADFLAQYAIESRVIAADLASLEAVEEVATTTRGLEVGLLVCAAGFGSSGRFLDAQIDQEVEMVDVNCRALMALSLCFGRRFSHQRRGGLVLMSSLVAFQGVPFAANYAATKAYVQSLAEALHVELAPMGVDVVASAPGPIHSGFAARAGMRMGMGLRPESVAQATLDALGRRGTIRPGWLSKLLETSLLPLPRWARVRMMGSIMKGMSGRDGDDKMD